MFAYIPARGGSKRVPRKNVRPLGGLPLIEHVIKNLSSVKGIKGIAVSSDDDDILRLASGHGNVSCLARREKSLAGDLVTFMDLVRGDLPRFCDHFGSSEVLFVLPTAVLVKTQHYEEGLNAFSQGTVDLVMSVIETPTNGFLSLTIGGTGETKAVFPEMFKLPTASLPKTYTDAGCFYIFSQDKAKSLSMLLDLERKTSVILPREVGVDVDTEDDFKRLETLYFQRKNE